jgi:hypothetical protein
MTVLFSKAKTRLQYITHRKALQSAVLFSSLNVMLNIAKLILRDDYQVTERVIDVY